MVAQDGHRAILVLAPPRRTGGIVAGAVGESIIVVAVGELCSGAAGVGVVPKGDDSCLAKGRQLTIWSELLSELPSSLAVALSLLRVQLAMSPAPTSLTVTVCPKIGTAISTAAADASSTLARYLGAWPRIMDVLVILNIGLSFPDAPCDDLCERPSFYSRPSRLFLVPTNAHPRSGRSKPLLRVVPFLRHHSSNLLRRGKVSLSLRPNFLELRYGEVRRNPSSTHSGE